MYRTQIRVNVTNQVQMLLSQATLKAGTNRSAYLQRMVAHALHRDLGIDVEELLPTPGEWSSVASSKYGGLRHKYTAKQPTISFMAMGRVQSLLYRAAQETGLPQSCGAYIRRELRATLAKDLDMDPDEIVMPNEIPVDADHKWCFRGHVPDLVPDVHIEMEKWREEMSEYDF